MERNLSFSGSMFTDSTVKNRHAKTNPMKYGGTRMDILSLLLSLTFRFNNISNIYYYVDYWNYVLDCIIHKLFTTNSIIGRDSLETIDLE